MVQFVSSVSSPIYAILDHCYEHKITVCHIKTGASSPHDYPIESPENTIGKSL